jgi:hypothetical protein
MEKQIENKLNTLENQIFRFECEKMQWRAFRELVASIVEMQNTFGSISEDENRDLVQQLEAIKYL